jgi:hypothetical protein
MQAARKREKRSEFEKSTPYCSFVIGPNDWKSALYGIFRPLALKMEKTKE